MGKMQRTKGAAAEREVVKIVQSVWPDVARNLAQSRDGGRDLVNTPPLCIEIKRQERLNLRSAYEQCKAAATSEEAAVVVHRSNHTQWLVTLSLEDFIGLTLSSRDEQEPD